MLWKVFTGNASAGYYNWSSPLIVNGAAYIGIASNCDKPLVRTFDRFGLDGLWWRSESLANELPACPHFCFVRGVDWVQVFGGRKPAGADVIGVGTERLLDLDVQISVAPNESRMDVADEAPEDVVRDHELAVDMRTGADAVDQQIHTLPYIRRRLGGERLEQHRKGTRLLQRERVVGESLHGGESLPLNPIPT